MAYHNLIKAARNWKIVADVSGHRTQYLEEAEEYPQLNLTMSDSWTVVLLFVASVNCVTALSAAVGNSLVLKALWKSRSLHPPSKALLSGLAVTDLLIGLFQQPTYAHYLFVLAGVDTNSNSILHNFDAFFIPGNVLLSVSTFVVTTIAVDRYLALYLRERYRIVVTQKRIMVLFAGFWVLAIVFSIIWWWLPTKLYGLWFAPLCVSIFISSFAFVKVTLQLQGHRVNQIGQPPVSRETHESVVRYRKSVETMVLVYASNLICQLPSCCTQGALTFTASNTALSDASLLATTFVNLSSSINPMVYCWRIREIRQSVLKSLNLACWD